MIGTTITVDDKIYNVIEFISLGVHGDVYKVEHDNIEYALKVSTKMSDNEKEFRSNVIVNNPQFFDSLVAIDDGCSQYDSIDVLNKNKIELGYHEKTILKRRKNAIGKLNIEDCSYRIYELLDDVLRNVYYKKSRIEMSDILVQIVNALHIMYSNGYSHNDFHLGNIGVKYTNDDYITIQGKSIPTHGIFIKVIDFDDAEATDKFSKNNDMLFLIYALASFHKFIRHCKKHNIKLEWSVYDTISDNILDMYRDDIDQSLNKEQKETIYTMLFQVFHYRDWQRNTLNNNKVFHPKKYVDNDTLKIIILNMYNPTKALECLLKKY